jgi:crotonobetainyl-CoA:carnitine CoA-transferase CaiB-like acyl-CoA transferase
VLEASVDVGAAYAGWLLARLGADVVRVDWTRRQLSSLPAADRNRASLARRFAHLDAGKPTIAAGAASFAASLDGVDVLLVDRPGWFERQAGMTLEALRRERPGLVVGATAPTPQAIESDPQGVTGLDAQALGGVVWAIGDPARAPLPYPPGVLEHQAGVGLAGAVLLALRSRDADGTGDRADVALSQVLAHYTVANAIGLLPWGLSWHRAGPRCYGSSGAYPYVLLPCRDGLVCLICRSRDEWARLVAAMGDPPWAAEPRYRDLRAMGTQYPEEVDALLVPWLAGRTRAELMAMGLEHSIPMAPVRTLPEVLETPQLQARRAWETLSLPEGDALAPALPFVTLGLDGEPLPPMPVAPSRRAPADAARPLAGLRVLDLGWVWSAPLLAGLLTEFGAEVVKVEHGGRLDVMRMRGRPTKDGRPVPGPSIELGPSFHQANHGKLGVTLDLKHPDGLELLRRMIADSDVLIENMSPGALERAGLGPDAIAVLNPGLVVVSMSAAGQTGPGAGMRAYAPVMSSFVGLEGLLGYDGEPPTGGLNFGLGDPNAAFHAMLALLAALRRRDRDGRGCRIDLSQIECLLTGIAAPLIDASLGAARASPIGARHPDLSPHGVYPTADADGWIAIAVTDDACWRALVSAMGEAAGAWRHGCESLAARLAHAAGIDRAIAAWTATRPRDGLCAALRAIGVPASPVLPIEQVLESAPFLWRGTLREVSHPITGPERLMVAPWRFGRIEARIERSSPTLGEHNRDVFVDRLGMAPEAFDALVASGAIG